MPTEISTIISENEKLIYSIAHHFKDQENLEDLFQVGCIGIISAYKNYDPSYQVKFSTYAYPYIVGEMKRLIRENRGMKVSRELTKLQLKIEKANILLSQRLMRTPSMKELSDFLDIDEFMLAEALKAKSTIKSIDEPICEDGKVVSLHDTVGQIEHMDMNTLIALREEVSKLPLEERMLIKKRYLEDQTQTEIANVLGISQVQVSRKEQKVLVKLKNKLTA